MTKVYLNGQFMDDSEAKVSVFDRCFLYGDGVFEGIAVWDRAPFGFWPHLERMRRGLAYLRIDNPHSDAEWVDLIDRTIAENQMLDGYLRVQISRGEGISSIKWERRLLRKPEPNVTIIPIPGFKDYYKGLIAEKMETGLKATMLSRPRISSAALPSGTKHCNYLNSVLGAIDVTAAHADIGIATDQEGFVTEGIAYNVFAARDGVILTPPTDRDLLPGITRAALIDIARREGFEVRETLFDSFTLASSDEVFICSTLELAVPVTEISGRPVGKGVPGPISKKLGKLLVDAMSQEAVRWNSGELKTLKADAKGGHS